MSFKNPFVYTIPSAEAFNPVSSINDHYIDLSGTNEVVAYWTKNTIFPSGNIYIDNGNITGNTWIKIKDKDLVSSNTTLYYPVPNEIISGRIINCYLENCNLYNVSICGNRTNTWKDSELNLTLKDCIISRIVYTGMNKFNNVNINCNIINMIHNYTQDNCCCAIRFINYTNVETIDEWNINIKDTVFPEQYNVLLGPMYYINNSNVPNDVYIHVKNLNITLDNCEKHGLLNNWKSIFCGGWVYSNNQSTGTVMYIDNINIVINSGKYFYYNSEESGDKNGNGIYVGGFVQGNGTLIIGNINYEINGGEFFHCYGGPIAQTNGHGIISR